MASKTNCSQWLIQGIILITKTKFRREILFQYNIFLKNEKE
uniref:Uncharacterized protein n=1 Tax=Rhizophora mucronata TaxID=61149 RepID=A0A2P2J0K8_RHIMU